MILFDIAFARSMVRWRRWEDVREDSCIPARASALSVAEIGYHAHNSADLR